MQKSATPPGPPGGGPPPTRCDSLRPCNSGQTPGNRAARACGAIEGTAHGAKLPPARVFPQFRLPCTTRSKLRDSPAKYGLKSPRPTSPDKTPNVMAAKDGRVAELMPVEIAPLPPGRPDQGIPLLSTPRRAKCRILTCRLERFLAQPTFPLGERPLLAMIPPPATRIIAETWRRASTTSTRHFSTACFTLHDLTPKRDHTRKETRAWVHGFRAGSSSD